MANTQAITYVRISEVLTDLGMITRDKATAEQRDGLHRHLGLTFERPLV
ncbi:hypothetical protein [Streptomyces chartreusis]